MIHNVTLWYFKDQIMIYLLKNSTYIILYIFFFSLPALLSFVFLIIKAMQVPVRKIENRIAEKEKSPEPHNPK